MGSKIIRWHFARSRYPMRSVNTETAQDLRGPHGAQDEFTLAAIAQNLRRLAKLVTRPPPVIAVCAA